MPLKTNTNSRAKHSQLSLRTSLFLETSILLLLTVILTILTAFFLARGDVHRRTMIQLEASADRKEQMLESIVSAQREQVAVLAQNPSLSALPAMTRLIGFQTLFSINAIGSVTVLEGTPPTTALREHAISSGNVERTTFVPFFNQRGWESYLIIAPHRNSRGVIISRLVAVFNSGPLLDTLLSTDYLGATAEVLMGTKVGNDLVLLHTSKNEDEGASPLHLGPFTAQLELDQPLAKAVYGLEGVEKTQDYANVPVFAAYRSTPSIGWGIVTKVDQHEIDLPVLTLARNLGLVGILLVVMLALTMYALAARITSPLEELTMKLRGLETKRWKFVRSIFTRNEIEEVDSAAWDLTKRLRQSYDHLEDIVKKRTQALTEQLAQDEAMFRSIDYGLLVTDTAGRITQMNEAAALLTGWSEEEAVKVSGTAVLALLDKSGNALSGEDHPLQETLSKKQKFIPATDPEMSLRRYDGKIVPLSLRITPIMSGKECFGSVAIFRDVTEERRIDRMKSEFISLVSHQLRTPLSSIRWYSQMLLSGDAGKLTDDQQQYLREVESSNVRMMHLIDALLNVSRIELGKLTVNIQPINLLNLVKGSEKLFAKDLDARHITVQYRKCNDEVAVVKSDAVLLQLIVENMVSNAIKYSRPHSTIVINLCADRGKKSATLSVVDAGIGIPPAEQAHMFEKMFRATNARTSDTDGNGLGLYTSRLAADLLGARLEFKSQENKGTTFTLTLPLRGK